MNSFVLMAKIIRSPELRYTQETQVPFAQMLVQFDGIKPEDPPSTLRVIGWGGLGTEISQQYSEGDQVILEGRLEMHNYETAEGFKEKRGELVLSHIYRVDGQVISFGSSSTPTGASFQGNMSNNQDNKVVSLKEFKPKQSEGAKTPVTTGQNSHESEPIAPRDQTMSSESGKDLDDIPF